MTLRFVARCSYSLYIHSCVLFLFFYGFCLRFVHARAPYTWVDRVWVKYSQRRSGWRFIYTLYIYFLRECEWFHVGSDAARREKRVKERSGGEKKKKGRKWKRASEMVKKRPCPRRRTCIYAAMLKAFRRVVHGFLKRCLVVPIARRCRQLFYILKKAMGVETLRLSPLYILFLCFFHPLVHNNCNKYTNVYVYLHEINI